MKDKRSIPHEIKIQIANAVKDVRVEINSKEKHHPTYKVTHGMEIEPIKTNTLVITFIGDPIINYLNKPEAIRNLSAINELLDYCELTEKEKMTILSYATEEKLIEKD